MVGVAYIDEILQSQVAFIRIMSLVLLSAAFIALGAATMMAYWVTRPINPFWSTRCARWKQAT